MIRIALAAALLVACSPSAPPPGSKWTALPSLPKGPRQEVGVAALNGKVFVIGGIDDRFDMHATVEVFDPAAGTWSEAAPLPAALHHPNTAVLNGKIYVVGALAVSFNATGDVFEYDPAADAWSRKASMPPTTERGASGTAALGGKIYIAGGSRGDTVSDFSSYDPATDRHEQLPPLPEALNHLVAAAVGDRLYAIGGRTGGTASVRGAVYAYDPAARSWQSKAAMPTARGGCAAAVVGDRIVVAGGEGNKDHPRGVFPQTEIYSPADDTWMSSEPMRTPRHGMGAAAVNGVVYVPGGATREGIGASAVVEAFTP